MAPVLFVSAGYDSVGASIVGVLVYCVVGYSMVEGCCCFFSMGPILAVALLSYCVTRNMFFQLKQLSFGGSLYCRGLQGSCYTGTF